MIRRHKRLVDVGDVAYGLAQTEGVGALSVGGDLVVVPAQFAYLHIPASELRGFVDGLFPNLATNKIADTAFGLGHRYRAGHDLLLDVHKTFSAHGSSEGMRHIGHILLTDFPTKAGIPIPGFSQSGLGHLLESVGIPNGWLHVSVFEAGVGIFAVANGASLLTQALQGALAMDFGTACQTFGVGTAEIVLAMAPPTQSALLLAGGIQNVLAGVISAWNTFSVYVDPLDFLGAAGTSALLGFGIAYGLTNQCLSDAALNSIRSGTIGALYTASTAFGFGALAGFVVCRLGSALAKRHNATAQDRLTVDESSYRLLLQELCAGNVDVQEILRASEPYWIESHPNRLVEPQAKIFACNAKSLPGRAPTLDSRHHKLDDSSQVFRAAPVLLADDPPMLGALYRSSIERGRR